jgi:hypothetical protein
MVWAVNQGIFKTIFLQSLNTILQAVGFAFRFGVWPWFWSRFGFRLWLGLRIWLGIRSRGLLRLNFHLVQNISPMGVLFCAVQVSVYSLKGRAFSSMALFQPLAGQVDLIYSRHVPARINHFKLELKKILGNGFHFISPI